MGKRFLDNAYDNARETASNKGLRYVFLISGIVTYWLVFAGHAVRLPHAFLTALSVNEMVVDMVSGAMPFALVIVWLALALPCLHNRSLPSLINANATLNYQRMGQGFAVWFAQMAALTSLDIWMHPGHYQWTFDPNSWFLLVLLSVILVPIKTSAEELFFRGYLMQGLWLVTKRPLVLMLVTGIAFSVPHWTNPEMLRGAFIWGALNYFMWGVIFAAITLKDNGLELALGVHAANNLFSYLLVTTPDSISRTQPLWVYQSSLDPKIGLLSLLIGGGIFYSIFFSRAARRQSTFKASPMNTVG